MLLSLFRWHAWFNMRQAYEPLFLKYGVDVVLSGHVHAYERSVRTYDLAPEPCGPAYLNLGDGGNRENTYATERKSCDTFSMLPPRRASRGGRKSPSHPTLSKIGGG